MTHKINNTAAYTLPEHSDELDVSIPLEHVLQLTLNRPKALNAMTPTMEESLRIVLEWFDEEPSLWVAVVTGHGRLFCAGADLKAWNTTQQAGQPTSQESVASSVHGFGSISRRSNSSKPIIAAVTGGAYGGGVEILLNCDLVIANEDAVFALPEVKRGVIAAQGVIPRLVFSAGRQLAGEMLLLGRTVTAREAYTRFGFVNLVVPTTSDVLPHALSWAKQITQNSPDSVQSTKRGLVLAAQFAGTEHATVAHAWSPESKRAYGGDNIKEGLKAFTEKRKPKWTNPAKL